MTNLLRYRVIYFRPNSSRKFKMITIKTLFDRLIVRIVNTFFQKQEEHIITYKSGNRRTTIYYILVKRTDLKGAKDCNVIPGEIIAMQHRILVMDYKLKTPMKKPTRKINRQIRWWNLKKEKARAEYQASVTTKLDDIGLDLDWNKIKEILISTAKEKLGQTSGKGAYNEKESL